MKKLNISLLSAFAAICWMGCEEGKIAGEAPLEVIPKPQETVTPLPEWVQTIPNPYVEWVNVFPGNIANEERRIEDTLVTLVPYYKKPSPGCSTNPTPFFSTGLYAPAAEVITVTVPAGLSGVGYRIGVWPCDLDHPCVGGNALENQKRYTKVYVKGNLTEGENKISNYFGGHIYLTFPQEVAGTHVFRFKGAVKSPDFISGDDGEAWKKAIATTTIQWGELRGKRFICTFPLEQLKMVTDPQRLIDFYDRFIFECYDELFGYSQDPSAPDNMRAVLTPWRVCLDKQQCGGAAHSGYPFVAGWNSDVRWVKHEELEAGNMWGLWHEIGHNFQNSRWRWSELGEVTCNLNIFTWYCRHLGYWVAGSRGDQFKATVENYVVNTPNAGKNNKVDLDVGQMLVPFVQLAYGLDWGVYKYLGIQNRTGNDYENSDAGKMDFFAKRVAEYAGANMMPFFEDWGFPVSKEAKCYISKFPAWETTAYGQAKGKFWRSFDYGPVTDPSIVDLYHEPDRSTFPDLEYDCGPKPIDRSGWTVVGYHPKVYSSEANYGPQKLLDGDLKSKFATATISGKADWPGYAVFDMQKEYYAGGVLFAQRDGTGSTNSRPKKLKVYVSAVAPVDGSGKFNPDFKGWTLLLEASPTTGGDKLQSFELEPEKWVKARYVKCEVLNPMVSGGQPCWAEFGMLGNQVQ